MKSSWRANVIRVGLGLVVGLGIAELGFRVRDKGAFPHLNIYVPDPALGARLKPGATEKIRFGSTTNPVTSVRINHDGYRGEDWPAPGPDEVIVVGDSQVFGLGVEEGDTFSAELARQLHAPVRNLGVPTYGPIEYNAVLAEQIEKRHGKTVIWVANIANDLFEAKRPNRERHVIQDGWALRTENAPKTRSFPGRSLLFTHSHAFVAFRRYAFAPPPLEGFASEGTWRDIGTAANDAEGEHVKADAEATRLMTQRERDIENAQRVAKEEAARVQTIVAKELTLREREKLGLVDVEEIPIREPAAEAERDFRVTARHIRIGADLRRKMEAMVRARAEATHDPRLLEVFAKRDASDAEVGRLTGAPPAKPIIDSPLAPAVRQAKEICDRVGARLLVVSLPLDVQVSPDEWTKYGAKPQDMSGSRILNGDIAAAAIAAGAEGFDAFDTMASAEPGAFLEGDIHMTKKGHQALAAGIAKALAPKPAR